MNREDLVIFFAQFWGLVPSQISDSLKLDDSTLKGHTSIRIYQFYAELESKFHVKVKNVGKITTLGDILKNIQ